MFTLELLSAQMVHRIYTFHFHTSGTQNMKCVVQTYVIGELVAFLKGKRYGYISSTFIMWLSEQIVFLQQARQQTSSMKPRLHLFQLNMQLSTCSLEEEKII